MAEGPNNGKMEKIVALCRRRGFIFQSSEIYGGINGFWDYGPLGVELKRNLKEAWWRDVVRCAPKGPDGHIVEMVGLDCSIIMNRRVWEASGHATGFNDPMVDDKETKQRFRADQLCGLFTGPIAERHKLTRERLANNEGGDTALMPVVTMIAATVGEAAEIFDKQGKRMLKDAGSSLRIRESGTDIVTLEQHGQEVVGIIAPLNPTLLRQTPAAIPSPFSQKAGSLTEPRQFNLMLQTHTGAVRDEASMTYLRPETAQGIFVNFRNVTDTSRVKIPFGIAQVGKAFRNEVTPRNFTFRSREFEQMEIEFFVHPSAAGEWYTWWRDWRFQWWQGIGLTSSNLQLRAHTRDELAHYAKDGAGTSDIEYRFPFTDPGFGELEGVAHRTDFDLRQHAECSGLGDKLKYFDQERNERYFPHVIEPSAGADRGALALLCEAYHDDPGRPSGVVLKFHPRMAPIKAAIFPLVDKEGMGEIAEKLYMDLRQTWNIQFDVKQNIGKRYARMDEVGTPFCFTVDTQTLSDQTVTVRYRDTLQQERLSIGRVREFLAEKIGG
ncbi:MAG: glycine--tRNA ligase [Phycisphaerae bacterium]